MYTFFGTHCFKIQRLLVHKKPEVMNMLPKEIYVEEGSLPASFDAIEEWPNYVTPPQDQGWCANSWVWSTIGVASDRLVTDECLPWTGDTPGRCSITKKPQAKFAK
ncbi:unnamed protein product [Nesidiocoris tenuis]|uniref:Uncharacterized protein n=1 Tax=Nesidiocoris tenuis TaxID=355587 RepID=A0A6H5HBS6_9HEMI|nr:unnamed protein product [Nesidiocoris tenuis]